MLQQVLEPIFAVLKVLLYGAIAAIVLLFLLFSTSGDSGSSHDKYK